MNCVHCDDTGSLSKDLHGYLDCARCGVADERAALGNWLLDNAQNCDDVSAWLIYQHGKAAAQNT